MCLIIVNSKGNLMPKEIAKTSAKINPHGLGIIWLDTFEVEYHKSNEYNRLITDRPFIAHFRYATVGKVGLSNTHPFICGKNKDELLMQNGTIQGIGNKEMCDSKVLAIKMGGIKRQYWKKELEKYDSRFCTINTRTRSFQIYNRNLYTYRDGIWYSKANVLQDNLVAVYGTLKKGFGNYYSYLKSSKFVGSGVTKDRYPLVVQGLPFLVNKRGIGYNVKVDVFKVSDITLGNLDALEGHPKWYRREKIDIKVKNGSTLPCWVYFNTKEVSAHTELHESFEYTPYQKQQEVFESEPLTFGVEAPQQTFEFGFTDNDFPTKETPTCIDCYNDVEHDGFANYYCSSCGGWFKEDEVLKYQE
tara:strand:+ start:7375 stop:8451 length:1077 start_codon:yes stop_codon:yes gene_type:complete